MAATKTKKRTAAKQTTRPRPSAAKAARPASPAKRKPARGGGNGLHLPSLAIKQFRGIEELEIPHLGQATLLVGENGVGKSTILEAVQIYASGGDPNVVTNILDEREDILIRENEDGDIVDVPDHSSLFFGYDAPKLGSSVKIGSMGKGDVLEIKLANLEPKELKDLPSALLSMLEGDVPKCLTAVSGSGRKPVNRVPFFQPKKKTMTEHVRAVKAFRRKLPKEFGHALLAKISKLLQPAPSDIQQIPCQKLGPSLPSNETLVSWYETVEMTAEGKRILELLHSIKPNIEILAAQGGSFGSDLRMMAKLKEVEFPVPLKKMGDGIVHLLGLAAALPNAKNGFLLIDEMENAIHFSLFPKLWKFVMQLAREYNVQIIAATHSWDCVVGFAEAALQDKDIQGTLFRIDREEDKTWVVPYTEKGLAIAARKRIEVR